MNTLSLRFDSEIVLMIVVVFSRLVPSLAVSPAAVGVVVAALITPFAALVAPLAALEAPFAALIASFATLEASFAALETALATLETAFATLETTLTGLVSAFARLVASLTTLVAPFAVLRVVAVRFLVIFVRNRFFGSDGRSFVLHAVERFDCLAALFVVRHFNKTVTFRPTGFTVHDHFGGSNFSELLEKSLQRLRRGVRGKPCGKNFHQCKKFKNK